DVASRNAGVQVALKLIDESDFDHEGRMDFVDNVIDRSTGTIRGRAVIANSKEIFTPGMFARVRVPGTAPYEALLVPDAAIGTEQARRFVMVVDDQDTARPKYVTLGQVTKDGLRAIKDGIGPDDRIVVSGLMQARPGQKVKPEEQGAKPIAGPDGAPQAAK
ncbi:MAG: efflux RND transporter periplasmic adaptor subunit, partial [Pseudolabrys sp.]